MEAGGGKRESEELWGCMHRTNLYNGNIIIHYLCIHTTCVTRFFSDEFIIFPLALGTNFAIFAIFLALSRSAATGDFSFRVAACFYDELFIRKMPLT